jgi:hypothetical protein
LSNNVKIKPVRGQVMILEDALANTYDLNGTKVTLTQTSNPDVYSGSGTDSRTYYLQVKKPTIVTVSIVGN